MPERKSYGQLFRERRIALGLTQVDVAARIGITQVAVSVFEKKSDHRARTRTLDRYAAALETTVEELFGVKP